MYIALNKNNKRVYAFEASKDEAYSCPICNNEVILKEGSIREKHFSHKANQCTDSWNYDMSEWHRRMQDYFPNEQQEVIVSYKGKKHRADILSGDIIIEFQNSPISVEEFCERNDFYTKCGYKVAWVFNLTKHFEEGRIFYPSHDDEWLRGWNYPLKVLEYGPIPQKDSDTICIWFSIEDEESLGYISKVLWAIEENDRPTYKRFKLSSNEIVLEDEADAQKLFYTKEDWINEEVRLLPEYTKKVCGIKGRKRHQYVCPKTNEFGIFVGGDNGCAYCDHCGIIVEKYYQKKYFEMYCCFPKLLEHSPTRFK